MSKKFNNHHGHIALFVANFIFGLNTPITRTIVPLVLDTFLMTFLRMSGAAILFWLTSLFLPPIKVSKKDIVRYFYASVFAIVANQTFFIYGLSKTSPIDASLVITLLPIITMVLASIFLKEKITIKKTIGVLIGASGAVILIMNSSRPGSVGTVHGNLFVLLSVFSFATYLTLFKNLISKYPLITSMKWMFLFATFLTLPMGYLKFEATNLSNLDTSIYLRIGYIVIMSTFITYMLIPIGQKTLMPTTVSMYNYLQPLVTSLFTIAIGMDNFGVEKAVSALLVFLGVYIVTKSKDVSSELR